MPTPKYRVTKWNPSEDGVLTDDNMLRKMSTMGYRLLNTATFPPGWSKGDHTHEDTRVGTILTGSLEVDVCGDTIVMEPGDMWEVEKDTVHRARVLGSDDASFMTGTKIE